MSLRRSASFELSGIYRTKLFLLKLYEILEKRFIFLFYEIVDIFCLFDFVSDAIVDIFGGN